MNSGRLRELQSGCRVRRRRQERLKEEKEEEVVTTEAVTGVGWVEGERRKWF